MRRKDIITLVIATLIIVVSVFFMLQMLYPDRAGEPSRPEAESVPVVPKRIDEEMIKKVDDLSDYGVPTQTGIGKEDLFSGF